MKPRDFLRNWPFARVNLGMSRREFLSLTPAEFNALCDEWKLREDRENRRIARICWAINISCVPRVEGDPLPTEEDFVPKPPLTEEEQELKHAELMRAKFMQATAGKKHV